MEMGAGGPDAAIAAAGKAGAAAVDPALEAGAVVESVTVTSGGTFVAVGKTMTRRPDDYFTIDISFAVWTSRDGRDWQIMPGALLGLEQLLATLARLALEGLALLVQLLAALDAGLLEHRVGLPARVLKNAVGFLAGASDRKSTRLNSVTL